MTATIEQVHEALERVNDPHVPVSLRRMGMVRDVTLEDGVVTVQLCVPCMACPGVGLLHHQIKEALNGVDGVSEVVIEDGWHLNWTREMIEPDVRDLMRANGIQI